MSLISGSMIEEGPWAEALPWVKPLTARKIGVCIVDHTGNDPNKTYGTTTKKWQFDSVMLMKDNKNEAVDISFTLEWLKHRLRTPDNRDDFRNFSAELANNAWSCNEVAARKVKTKISDRQSNAMDQLFEVLLAQSEMRVPISGMKEVNTVECEVWREQLKQRGAWRDIKNRTH